MSKLSVGLALILMNVAACAHHGAVKVSCDGVLRRINPSESEAPVSVVPDASSKDLTEKRP